MFSTGWNRDGVPGPDFTRFAFNADFSRAVGDVINLLGARMKMFLRARAGGQTRLGETLVADGGITMCEQFADFRSVLRGEGGDFIKIFYIHKICQRSKTFGCFEY